MKSSVRIPGLHSARKTWNLPITERAKNSAHSIKADNKINTKRLGENLAAFIFVFSEYRISHLTEGFEGSDEERRNKAYELTVIMQ